MAWLAIGLLVTGAQAASARQSLIIAVGADNVAGHGRGKHSGGVPSSLAFPAQLQTQLRAKGVDALVVNAGEPGDVCTDIQARFDDAVPDGASLVIIDRPNGNDKKAGLKDEQSDCIAELSDRLSRRHIPLLILPPWKDIPGAVENRDPDGHHFTAQGHAQIAAYLLPKVMDAISAH